MFGLQNFKFSHQFQSLFAVLNAQISSIDIVLFESYLLVSSPATILNVSSSVYIVSQGPLTQEVDYEIENWTTMVVISRPVRPLTRTSVQITTYLPRVRDSQ